MTNAIKAMYSIVRSVVKHKQETSDIIDIKLGVKQGDPSSSLLFMLFVNDIIDNINSFCFMSWCLKFFCAVGALCMFSYF